MQRGGGCNEEVSALLTGSFFGEEKSSVYVSGVLEGVSAQQSTHDRRGDSLCQRIRSPYHAS